MSSAAPFRGNMDTTLAYALAYASLGWKVFPCKPKSKVPATKNGFHDASSEALIINAWWLNTPDANVALALV